MRQLSFKRHHFPPEIIRHSIWLHARFTLSFRDVEEMLVERGLDVSYDTIRRWFLKFGSIIAANLSNDWGPPLLSIHAATCNTFYHQRHRLKRPMLKEFRTASFEVWQSASIAT